MILFRYEDAMKYFEELVDFYKQNNVKVSIRLSQIEQNIMVILSKQGKFDKHWSILLIFGRLELQL
jgi:hypothetical protein